MKPTRQSVGGRRYLDLQKYAKKNRRPTDEVLQLYALEGFLERLSKSGFAEKFILKGGTLLAVFDARRPTRDIDFSAIAFSNELTTAQAAVVSIASIEIDDGLMFDISSATSESIREDDQYTGVRVRMDVALLRAKLTFQVDINVGDPIVPSPQQIEMPRLLSGTISLWGYPIEMVLAEKIVTAIQRKTLNTRWRDFLDVYQLIQKNKFETEVLTKSIQAVAEYRGVTLQPLSEVLAGFGKLGQEKWNAWLRKSRLGDNVADFAAVIGAIATFADPILATIVEKN